MKQNNLKIQIAVIAICLTSFSTYAEEYYDVNTAPDARAREYRQGEVIMKFKTESAVQVRRSAAGRFQSTGVSTVDNLLQTVGANEIEQLMPLTGALTATSPHKVRSHNGTDVVIKDMSKLYCLKIGNGDVEDVVEQLMALPEVEFAEPNYIVYINSTPNDPLYSEQWGIPAVNADKLWDKPTITDKRPVIAILDTGIDITHPDLAANIWTNELEASGSDGYDDDGNGFVDDIHGWDFVNQRGTIDDYNGHGTHCAGIAAAVGNNGIGICGANPDALIMPVTVMQSDGTGDLSTIIKGIDYAISNGADVLSMSIGTYAYSIALEESLARAYMKSLLVAAAGNDSRCIYYAHHQSGFGPMFPAAFAFVLGVQASLSDGNLAGFSNWDCDGPIYFDPSYYNEKEMYNYELVAPGTNITSTFPGGRYKALNGTSMACPLVAGAVSRLLSTKEYPTKELLFGDLINSAGAHVDFDACYAITDANRTPNVSLVTWRIEDETDGDGRFDAGETINFYPTVRNEWGTANNVKTWIEVDELDKNFLDILSNNINLEKTLSAYAKAESLNPLRIKIKDDVVDDRHCKFTFCTECDGMSEPYRQEIVFVVENGIEIGGIIDKNMTLTADANYLITNNILINEDATLTINPGVKIKFNGDYGIKCNGTLKADGLPNQKIIFDGNGHIMNLQFGFETELNYIEFKNFIFGSNCISGILNNCLLYNLYDNDGWGNFAWAEINSTNIYGVNFDVSRMFCDTWLYDFKGKNNNIVGIHYARPTSEYFKIGGSVSLFYGGQNVMPSDNGFIMAVENEELLKSDNPSYFGSGREEIVRQGVWDIDHYYGFGKFDLSNILIQPNPEAHGIIWKVVVDDYDAQDEFEKLTPLGVGRHKFEIWYSKVIETSFAPTIAMGVRPPYNSTSIAEDGSWRTETIRFIPWGNGVPVSINGYFENWILKTLSGNPQLNTRISEGFEGTAGICFAYGPSSYKICQTLTNIQNGKYRFKFKVQPEVLTEDGTQYIFANDDQTLVTSTDVATYEVITEVRRNRIEFGFAQETPIENEVRFDDAELELLEEYPNGWDVDVSVYTAYLDIKGGMAIDGLNRIYVNGCQDLEYFDIPLENTRFNVEVAAAGSMSTGFMATPGIGKVDLEWEDQDEKVDDILGYNLYRSEDKERIENVWEENPETGNWEWFDKTIVYTDTIRVNERLLDGTTYTDYNVVPGKRYDYYYKILRTSMDENSPSRVVSVVPLTAQKGDANGSLSVDVSDVVTEVSYITGGNPQPFIFDAADVNEDTEIDVLDIVGTVRLILYPDAAGVANEGNAKYWIKDSVLWLENEVTLGGVQFTLNGNPDTDTFSALEGLDGMEVAGAWNGNDYTMLAYSMSNRSIAPGVHPMLSISSSDAAVLKALASDNQGYNIMTLQADMSGMSVVEIAQMRVPSPNPFVEEVNIPYVVGDNGNHKVEIVMTNLAGACVDRYATVCSYGEYSYTWCPAISSGVYFATLLIDGTNVQTAKIIKK